MLVLPDFFLCSLRITKMRQEMSDADPGAMTDDTLNDIFKDFAQIASNDPDKLKRSTHL